MINKSFQSDTAWWSQSYHVKPGLVQDTRELVSSAVVGSVTVDLVSPVRTVLAAVTGQTTVDTHAALLALELPVGALVLQAGHLVSPVITVAVPVTPPPEMEHI